MDLPYIPLISPTTYPASYMDVTYNDHSPFAAIDHRHHAFDLGASSYTLQPPKQPDVHDGALNTTTPPHPDDIAAIFHEFHLEDVRLMPVTVQPSWIGMEHPSDIHLGSISTPQDFLAPGGLPPADASLANTAPTVLETSQPSEGKVAKPRVVRASLGRRRTTGKYECRIKGCGQTFTARHNLKFHTNSHFRRKPYHCHGCSRGFATPSDRRRHEKTCAMTRTSAECNSQSGI